MEEKTFFFQSPAAFLNHCSAETDLSRILQHKGTVQMECAQKNQHHLLLPSKEPCSKPLAMQTHSLADSSWTECCRLSLKDNSGDH